MATALFFLGLLAAAEPAAPGPERGSSAAESAAATEVEPFLSDADFERAGVATGLRAGDPAPPVGDTLGRMGGALMLVLALVAGAAWLARRTLARRRSGGLGPRHLELLETMPLGLKRSVSLLRLGGRVLVLGQSEQGLCALADWPVQELTGGTVAPEQPRPEQGFAAVEPDDASPSPASSMVLQQALAAHAQAQAQALGRNEPAAATRVSRFQERLRAALVGDR